MAKLKNYDGSIDLISGIRQKNNGDFPLMDAHAVQTREDGTRLDAEIEEIRSMTASGGIAITTTPITGGHQITITDANGVKTIDIMDGNKGEAGRGISSIVRTDGMGEPGTIDTYTITYTDDTTSTFTVYNGVDGLHAEIYSHKLYRIYALEDIERLCTLRTIIDFYVINCGEPFDYNNQQTNITVNTGDIYRVTSNNGALAGLMYLDNSTIDSKEGTVIEWYQPDLENEGSYISRYTAVLHGKDGESYELTDEDKTEIAQEVGNIITVPTKTSELTNDSGFLTEHQDISALTAHTENNNIHVTADEKAKWDNKSDFSGSYNDLKDTPTIPTVPTNISAFSNDSGFITKTVSDLINYYTKSESYTKDEVNGLISSIPKFSISVVSTLPTSDISTTTIYLKNGGDGEDLYTEYIYVNGKWEILGSQRVDLTGYAMESWVNTQLTSYLKQTALTEAISTALAQAKSSGEFDGDNGVSPTITTSAITGGNRITITDANGTKNVDIMNGNKGDTGKGISKVERTNGNGAAGTTDTYTITYTDNTTSTFTVYNGKDGTNGTNGVSISKVEQTTTSTTDGGTNVITVTLSNEQTATFNVKNGSKGSDGAKPVKGTDYFTDADKIEMVNAVMTALPAAEGAVF